MSERQSTPAASGDQILTGLAILKANWDEGQRSYLDNFLPFVADCMHAAATDEITPAELSQALRERFGIPLPEGVIQTLLKKAARAGMGERKQGRFAIDRAAVQGHDLTKQRSDVLRREEALVDRLIRFSQEHHDLELDREGAERALLAHLDRHATSILRAALRGHDYQPPLADESGDYVVSEFVVHTLARDPEGFDYLESLVKGLMLATVVYLPTPGEAGRRFEGVTLYFDTRLLLQALGYEGPEAEASLRQPLELAYELGARLAAFTDTVAEARGVLSGIANSLHRTQRPESRRQTEEWIRKQGYSRSDVELLIEGLEDDLKGLRITVNDRPGPEVALTVDEVELERQLQERLRYQSRAALLHDLDALTAIFRLRSGQRQSRLEHCRALFVTTNTPLVGVARQFFHSGDHAAIPLALPDEDFATLVWLKRPLDAPDLPRLRIIADCYAALEPGNDLWAKYLDEVDRLRTRGSITEDDFFLLRYSFDAKQALMSRTLGSVAQVSPELVEEVLERTRDAIRSPEVERARAAEASSSSAEKAASDAIARATEAEKRASLAEGTARSATQIIDAQRRRARNTGERRGRVARWSVLGVLTSLAAALAYFSLPSSLDLPPSDLEGTVRLVLRLVFLVAAGLFVVLQILGHSPSALARQAEVRVSRNAEQKLLAEFGLTEHRPATSRRWVLIAIAIGAIGCAAAIGVFVTARDSENRRDVTMVVRPTDRVGGAPVFAVVTSNEAIAYLRTGTQLEIDCIQVVVAPKGKQYLLAHVSVGAYAERWLDAHEVTSPLGESVDELGIGNCAAPIQLKRDFAVHS